jgi:RimJ/RimL family protein N-acetyltransferase
VLPWIASRESLELWTAYSFDYPLTREHLQKHLRESTERGDRLIFKAVDVESADGAGSGEVIGHIELGAIDHRNQSMRIGRVLLAATCRGRGLGAEMMRAALAMAFDQFQMHRVELGVFDVNPRAIVCYERVGFRREGMRRESFRSSTGVYWSEITMSILAGEWAAR